jgi:hypothetical protein
MRCFTESRETSVLIDVCIIITGKTQRMRHHFGGSLAGLSVWNNVTLTKSMIHCLSDCRERLDFTAVDDLDNAMVVLSVCPAFYRLFIGLFSPVFGLREAVWTAESCKSTGVKVGFLITDVCKTRLFETKTAIFWSRDQDHPVLSTDKLRDSEMSQDQNQH